MLEEVRPEAVRLAACWLRGTYPIFSEFLDFPDTFGEDCTALALRASERSLILGGKEVVSLR